MKPCLFGENLDGFLRVPPFERLIQYIDLGHDMTYRFYMHPLFLIVRRTMAENQLELQKGCCHRPLEYPISTSLKEPGHVHTYLVTVACNPYVRI